MNPPQHPIDFSLAVQAKLRFVAATLAIGKGGDLIQRPPLRAAIRTAFPQAHARDSEFLVGMLAFALCDLHGWHLPHDLFTPDPIGQPEGKDHRP